jgi:hypothetical protein
LVQQIHLLVQQAAVAAAGDLQAQMLLESMEVMAAQAVAAVVAQQLVVLQETVGTV